MFRLPFIEVVLGKVQESFAAFCRISTCINLTVKWFLAFRGFFDYIYYLDSTEITGKELVWN